MKPRTARFIAWSLAALYITLAAIGLTLQIRTNTSYTNIAFPVLLVIIPLIGIWPIVGALIISRHPGHPVGWLLSVGLLAAAFDMFFSGYVAYDTNVYAGTLPGMTVALIWLKWSGFPFATTAFTLMILLFPDGRPPSPFWRKVTWLAVGTLLFFLPIQAVEPGAVDPFTGISLNNPLGGSPSLWAILEPLWLLGLTMLALCNLAAVISLILRLRRARGDERQQIKWLLIPAAGYFVHTPFSILALVETNAQILGVAIALVLPSVAGMVIATAFAIFKYRLYDIDLLISRSLVYGLLTMLVVGIYILFVGALGTFFQAQGNLVIALLATGIVAVLFQPLRERLQRGVNRLIFGERDDPIEALSRLGRRLETAIPTNDVLPMLVETIAHTLKLPYVSIQLQAEKEDNVSAEYGVPPQELAHFPLLYQGESIGHLMVALRSPGTSFSPAEMRLLRNIARQAGAAVHAVRLMADLQRSRQRLVAAREEERMRLRRDLHDGLGPALASVVWQADSARDLVYTDPSAAEQLLESSIEQAQSALTDIRRLVYGLRPPALDELGLVGALEQAAQQHQQAAVTIEAPALPSLPAAVEVATYRIVQEALKNAVEHGQADHCLVDLALDGNLCLTIADDGLGLPETMTPGVGLVSMRERAEELGGAFNIRPRLGRGTKVEVSLPLELGR
jgi:signal transduction histidine kinase